MVAAVGALVSFEEGSPLLAELAGIHVDAHHVQHAAQTPGSEIAEPETRSVEAETDLPLPATLYLGSDGTGRSPARCRTPGPLRQTTDGSAKTREVKLGTIWSAESRDAENRPVRDQGSVTYTAAMESCGPRLMR